MPILCIGRVVGYDAISNHAMLAPPFVYNASLAFSLRYGTYPGAGGKDLKIRASDSAGDINCSYCELGRTIRDRKNNCHIGFTLHNAA